MLCPILSRTQHPLCLGILEAVVVKQRHRILAAMYDRLLSKGIVVVAHLRAVSRVIVPTYPRQEYPVALGYTRAKVIVGLEIVHDKIIGCREAPEFTFQRGVLGLVHLIDPPEVSLAQVERPGIVGRFSH